MTQPTPEIKARKPFTSLAAEVLQQVEPLWIRAQRLRQLEAELRDRYTETPTPLLSNALAYVTTAKNSANTAADTLTAAADLLERA